MTDATLVGDALQAELDFVRALVDRCGAAALEYQREAKTAVEHKGRSREPVTPADRALNTWITDALAERFPGDAIVAEETAERQPWSEATRCWFVDPIDGTRSYAKGRSDWTVQIGLCIEGVPVLGVVAEPSKHRTSWAVRIPTPVGYTETADGSRVPLAVTSRAWSRMRFIGGRRNVFSRQQAVARRLGIGPWRMRVAGSVGVRMTAIARGEAEIYVQSPGRPKLWDSCAPEVLVTAAGGHVSDWRGRLLDYRQPTTTHMAGVIVCHPRHHDEILRRLEPLADLWIKE